MTYFIHNTDGHVGDADSDIQNCFTELFSDKLLLMFIIRIASIALF